MCHTRCLGVRNECDPHAHALRQRLHHLHVSKGIFHEYALCLTNYTFSPYSFMKLQFWFLNCFSKKMAQPEVFQPISITLDESNYRLWSLVIQWFLQT